MEGHFYIHLLSVAQRGQWLSCASAPTHALFDLVWFCLVFVSSVGTPCVRVVYGDDGRVECLHMRLSALFGPVRLRLEFGSWHPLW